MVYAIISVSCFSAATLPELNSTNFAELFIEGLETSNTFDAVSSCMWHPDVYNSAVIVQEEVSSFSEAIDKVDDGDAYFGVEVNTSFSDSLLLRYACIW